MTVEDPTHPEAPGAAARRLITGVDSGVRGVPAWAR